MVRMAGLLFTAKRILRSKSVRADQLAAPTAPRSVASHSSWSSESSRGPRARTMTRPVISFCRARHFAALPVGPVRSGRCRDSRGSRPRPRRSCRSSTAFPRPPRSCGHARAEPSRSAAPPTLGTVSWNSNGCGSSQVVSVGKQPGEDSRGCVGIGGSAARSAVHATADNVAEGAVVADHRAPQFVSASCGTLSHCSVDRRKVRWPTTTGRTRIPAARRPREEARRPEIRSSRAMRLSEPMPERPRAGAHEDGACFTHARRHSGADDQGRTSTPLFTNSGARGQIPAPKFGRANRLRIVRDRCRRRCFRRIRRSCPPGSRRRQPGTGEARRCSRSSHLPGRRS